MDKRKEKVKRGGRARKEGVRMDGWEEGRNEGEGWDKGHEGKDKEKIGQGGITE